MSGPWSPTPCRLVFEIVYESRVRMTVLFQCKLWLLPALFISQSPAHHRVYHDARSRDRERGRAQQVEWCRCTVHVCTSRSDRLLFPTGSASATRTAQRGPTAERPCPHVRRYLNDRYPPPSHIKLGNARHCGASLSEFPQVHY